MVNGLFYIFAFLAVVSGFMVIIAKNPVRAVLALISTFVCTSVVWLLLEIEFLAWALILIYVGAVMVLFLFVIMMLNIEDTVAKSRFTRFLPLGICVPLLLVIMLVNTLGTKNFSLDKIGQPEHYPANFNNVKQLGITLFTDYMVHVELAGMILLAALIAAIAINAKVKNKRTPVPRNQVDTCKKSRLRLVDLPRRSAGDTEC